MPRESLAAIAAAAPKVNRDIGELFANMDLTECRSWAGDNAGGTTSDMCMRDKAEWFVAKLAAIGVTPPEVDDLLADFYGRV